MIARPEADVYVYISLVLYVLKHTLISFSQQLGSVIVLRPDSGSIAPGHHAVFLPVYCIHGIFRTPTFILDIMACAERNRQNPG